MTLTPPLVGMLRDELLMSRYAAARLALRALRQGSAPHQERSAVRPLARHYRDHLYHLRRLFHDRYRRDLVAASKRLQDAGALEIITCGATHGFLPLMVHQEAIRAQVQVACMHYRMHFGREPPGDLAPRMRYAPGIDRYLAAENIRFFFVDSHALANACPARAGPSMRRSTRPAGWLPSPRSGELDAGLERRVMGTPATRSTASSTGTSAGTWTTDYIRPYIQATGDARTPGSSTTGSPARSRGREGAVRPARRGSARKTHAGNFFFNRGSSSNSSALPFGTGRPRS